MDSEDLDTRVDGSDVLVSEISTAYGLDPLSWRDVGGSWTTNLAISQPTGGTVVARIHQGWTDRDRLLAEQAVRSVLSSSGVPTVPAQNALSGDTVVRLSSGRLAEVETYVPAAGRMNTPELMATGFALLGTLHDVLRTAKVLPPAAGTVSHANHLSARDAAQATRRGASRVRSWDVASLTSYADAVTAHVEAVAFRERPYEADQLDQLVHGDFWDNNVLFDGDVVAAVLDFGFMARRSRVDDLALPMWFLLLEPGRGLPTDEDKRVVRRLVDAYDSAADRPLSIRERRSLPLAVARQPAWSIGRWVNELDEDDARRHAQAAKDELPVAEAVLADLSAWQDALS